MSDIAGTTRAQTKFLRSFRASPHGPPAEDWPSPTILRRWMDRPAFIREMRSLRAALIYQSDFQLLSVAASASHVLHETVASRSEAEMQNKETETIVALLKLSHARQRFASS